jgi:hypothetical protein
MAAGLRKIAELAWSAFAADALPCHDHWAFIKPGIIIVGTEHNVYYAYLSELNSADPSQDTSTSTLSQSSATILVCPPSPTTRLFRVTCALRDCMAILWRMRFPFAFESTIACILKRFNSVRDRCVLNKLCIPWRIHMIVP